MTNSKNPRFKSNDHDFICIDGIRILNDRNAYDFAYLTSSDSSGILVGTDGYPGKNNYDDYFIAGGGEDIEFQATAIEFYGVKTQT